MKTKLLTATILAAALSTAAFAQSNPAPQNKPAQQTNTTQQQNASATGEWQGSKLIHLNVYNEQNEKIGDIKELMLDKSGKIAKVVIGVGGFLSMGEHDVAVNFDQLKWVNEPVSNNSASNRPATAPANTAANAPARNTTTGSNAPAMTTTASSSNANRTYPDHAVLSGASKDQLKAMPQFNYNK